MQESKYDLEDRLLEFSTRIVRVAESMTPTRASSHISDQLLRAGTSPYGHHGEAEGAESRADFIHKMRVCHKELRESRRWLRLIGRVPLVAKPELLVDLLTESDELVRIFAASIRTAEANRSGNRSRSAQRLTLNAQIHGRPEPPVSELRLKR